VAEQTHVLVIDDEPAIRLLCRVNLEHEGFRVTEASDGYVGIEAARRDPPDVILLDIRMPGVEGWTVAEWLLDDPRTATTPIVFLTPVEALARAAVGAGGIHVIVEPFNPVELGSNLKEILRETVLPFEPRREALRQFHQRWCIESTRRAAKYPRDPVPPVLSAELFADEEAYSETANNLLRSPDRSRPRPIVMSVASNLISPILSDTEHKRWLQSIVEMFGIAYMLVQAETWEALDGPRAIGLMNEGLDHVRQQRALTGDEPISLTDSNDRVSFTTLGLVGAQPTFAELSSYLEEQPTAGRLAHLGTIYELAGTAMVDATRRHAERFNQLQRMAWRFGIALGFLDVLGEIPQSLEGVD
jgi:CheY-like chemotaxis protein